MKKITIKEICKLTNGIIGFQNIYTRGWFQKVNYHDDNSYATFVCDGGIMGNGYHYDGNKIILFPLRDFTKQFSKAFIDIGEWEFYSFDHDRELLAWLAGDFYKKEKKEVREEIPESTYSVWLRKNFSKDNSKSMSNNMEKILERLKPAAAIANDDSNF